MPEILFAFDLTSNPAFADHSSLIKVRNLQAVIHFAQALSSLVNMISFGIAVNVIEINHGRNVPFD